MLDSIGYCAVFEKQDINLRQRHFVIALRCGKKQKVHFYFIFIFKQKVYYYFVQSGESYCTFPFFKGSEVHFDTVGKRGRGNGGSPRERIWSQTYSYNYNLPNLSDQPIFRANLSNQPFVRSFRKKILVFFYD